MTSKTRENCEKVPIIGTVVSRFGLKRKIKGRRKTKANTPSNMEAALKIREVIYNG